MATILPFLRADENVFTPNDIAAMSMVLDEVCKDLNMPDGPSPEKQIVATRIIDLARQGIRSPTVLRDRVLYEADQAKRVGLGP